MIAHDAPERTYVLVNWWAETNELYQRMLSAPADHLEALAPHGSDAIGCVWELEIIDFERRARLDHVPTGPHGPNSERYLAPELNTDV